MLDTECMKATAGDQRVLDSEAPEFLLGFG
jgi:hypothetical protein